MRYWIRRGSNLFGIAVFFIVLLCCVPRSGTGSSSALVIAVAIAFTAALVSWFVGTVLGDIIIKGMLVDIGRIGPEDLAEGGILQRFHQMNERLTPGGADIPFVNIEPPPRAAPNKAKS
jgi:hypothetical protein